MQKVIRPLGILKEHGPLEAFMFYEYQYLKDVKKALTVHWAELQGGWDVQATRRWLWCMELLDLDPKAAMSLMLLAQSGEVGRAEANEILWTLLADYGLSREYRDLSAKTVTMVNLARRNFDKPPMSSSDARDWTWKRLSVPRARHWSPRAVPKDLVGIRRGVHGEPLPPPNCWIRQGGQ